MSKSEEPGKAKISLQKYGEKLARKGKLLQSAFLFIATEGASGFELQVGDGPSLAVPLAGQ